MNRSRRVTSTQTMAKEDGNRRRRPHLLAILLLPIVMLRQVILPIPTKADDRITTRSSGSGNSTITIQKATIVITMVHHGLVREISTRLLGSNLLHLQRNVGRKKDTLKWFPIPGSALGVMSGGIHGCGRGPPVLEVLLQVVLVLHLEEEARRLPKVADVAVTLQGRRFRLLRRHRPARARIRVRVAVRVTVAPALVQAQWPSGGLSGSRKAAPNESRLVPKLLWVLFHPLQIGIGELLLCRLRLLLGLHHHGNLRRNNEMFPSSLPSATGTISSPFVSFGHYNYF